MCFTMNYVSLCRALCYGFLSPIKATSGYKLDWLVGKLYFGSAQMITKFDGDITIAAAPIGPSWLWLCRKIVDVVGCSLYLLR